MVDQEIEAWTRDYQQRGQVVIEELHFILIQSMNKEPPDSLVLNQGLVKVSHFVRQHIAQLQHPFPLNEEKLWPIANMKEAIEFSVSQSVESDREYG